MSNSVQHAPSPEYLSCVERDEEMARLQSQPKIRKSLLVFGPEGVGKSRLLRRFVDSQPLALYVAQMRAPREFLLTLLHALQAEDSALRVPGNLAALSTASLKGFCG